MKNKLSVSFEVDFDYAVKKAINQNKSIFSNLCKRYPNDIELGKAIRKIINDL
jgi:hypothetical protein